MQPGDIAWHTNVTGITQRGVVLSLSPDGEYATFRYETGGYVRTVRTASLLDALDMSIDRALAESCMCRQTECDHFKKET